MTKSVPVLDTLAGSWLALQCQMIPSVHRGAVFLDLADNETPSNEEDPAATACWPEGSNGTPALTAATKRVIAGKCPVVCGQNESAGIDEQASLNIACPILVEGRFAGVVAVEVSSPNEQQQRAVMQLLQWGSTWLEFIVRRESSSVTSALMTATRVVATGLERGSFQDAATATATELAACMVCERVSVGFRDNQQVRVQAISHSAKFNKKTNFVRDIEVVMQEALAQGDAIVFPGHRGGPVQITTAHAEFANKHDTGAICTVPLGDNGSLYGALMFERGEGQTFDDSALELCEITASLLGPILELKRKEDRWLGAKIWDAGRRLLNRILGLGHPGLKLALVSIIGLTGFLAIATGEYRVSAKAMLEGTVQRVVVAPMEGFIATANTRAGDLVREGEVMGALDDKDLRLESLRWSGQREQLLTEYREALANRDRTQTRVLKAQIAQAEAQLELLDEQLARTKLVSPFDGVIVTGDLSQQFGSPVERGQVLFEVAPLDSYRVILEVDERDISKVTVGQPGRLALTALSGEVMPFTVEKVTPVSDAEDGRNFFRVEAKLEAEAPLADMRPGMLGVGKVEIGERKLLWIWTYKLVNWLRLWAWSWWP